MESIQHMQFLQYFKFLLETDLHVIFRATNSEYRYVIPWAHTVKQFLKIIK
jgi:hypothetical protein